MRAAKGEFFDISETIECMVEQKIHALHRLHAVDADAILNFIEKAVQK